MGISFPIHEWTEPAQDFVFHILTGDADEISEKISEKLSKNEIFLEKIPSKSSTDEKSRKRVEWTVIVLAVLRLCWKDKNKLEIWIETVLTECISMLWLFLFKYKARWWYNIHMNKIIFHIWRVLFLSQMGMLIKMVSLHSFFMRFRPIDHNAHDFAGSSTLAYFLFSGARKIVNFQCGH